jgi:hypothetical protein
MNTGDVTRIRRPVAKASEPVRQALLPPGWVWRCASVLLSAAALFHAPPAVSQPAETTPPAPPLPVVVYPSRAPQASQPERAPVLVPRPEDDSDPEQYVLLDGVWGYRDRSHRFRPLPAAIGRETDRRFEAPRSEIGARFPPPRNATLQLPAPRERNPIQVNGRHGR